MMIATNQLRSDENPFRRSAHRPSTNLTTSAKNQPEAVASRPALFEEDQQWLEQVTHCVQQNLANNHFTIYQLANQVAISERQLRRRLKQLLGLGPSKYLQ